MNYIYISVRGFCPAAMAARGRAAISIWMHLGISKLGWGRCSNLAECQGPTIQTHQYAQVDHVHNAPFQNRDIKFFQKHQGTSHEKSNRETIINIWRVHPRHLVGKQNQEQYIKVSWSKDEVANVARWKPFGDVFNGVEFLTGPSTIVIQIPLQKSRVSGFGHSRATKADPHIYTTFPTAAKLPYHFVKFPISNWALG